MHSAGIFHSKLMDLYLLRDVPMNTSGYILKWVCTPGKIPAVWIPLPEVNSDAPLHYKGCIPAVRIPLPEVNSGAPLHYKGCIPAVWIPLPEANSGGSLHYKGFITAVWISLLELNGALKFPGKGVALSIYPLFHQTGSKSFLGVWSLLKKRRLVWSDTLLIEDGLTVLLLSIRDFSREIF